LSAVLSIGILALIIGLGLGWAKLRLKSNDSELVTAIDALLPQTQCAQCNFPGCRPYAEAIASGTAQINQCPPGGEALIQALSTLTGKPALALNPENGIEKPILLAQIRESECIGCTLCIQACPVDAIIGAAQRMHSVIDELCTGCELCLPPCPVDCIDLFEPQIQKPQLWRRPMPAHAQRLPIQDS